MTFQNVFFSPPYETVYFNKFLSLNSVRFYARTKCRNALLNGCKCHIKVYSFSIRINENLKIGYFDLIFEKWLYLPFQDRPRGPFTV